MGGGSFYKRRNLSRNWWFSTTSLKKRKNWPVVALFLFFVACQRGRGRGGVAGFRVCLVTGNTGCQWFLSVPVCCCCELLIHHNTEAKSMRKEQNAREFSVNASNRAGGGAAGPQPGAASGLRDTPSHHFSSKSRTMSGEAGLKGSGPKMPERVESCHPDT